jgi:hypothetical protein
MVHQYKYFVAGHYPLSCLYLKTSSCFFFKKTFRRLDSVSGPQIGTSSIDWAQLSRFNLKTETIKSPKRCVLKNKEDGVYR